MKRASLHNKSLCKGSLTKQKLGKTSLAVALLAIFTLTMPLAAFAQSFLWTDRFSSSQDDRVRAVATDGTFVYVVGQTAGTLASTRAWYGTDAGTAQPLNDVQIFPSGTGYAVGDTGVIVATTDGGETWSVQTSGTTEDLHGVHFTTESVGIAVGGAGVILRTTDGGATWTAVANSFTETLRDVYFVDPLTVVACGNAGRILFSSDGGASFANGSNVTSNTLFAIGFADDAFGTIVGDNGELLRTTSSGDIWFQIASPAGGAIYDVDYGSSTVGFAAAEDGVIQTIDGGASWSAAATSPGNGGLGISFFDASNGTVVGFNGEVFRTDDGGVNWLVESGTVDARFNAVSMLSLNEVVAVGSVYDNFDGVDVGMAALVGVAGFGGTSDAYVAQYDTSGNQQWVYQFGTQFADEATCVAVDGSGVYVGGLTFGSLSGSYNPDSGGSSNAFVLKLDSNGVFAWVNAFGEDGSDGTFGVASDGTSVYAVGQYETFLTESFTPAFIRRFLPAGNETWTRYLADQAGDRLTCVAIDQSGNAVAGGITTGAFVGTTNQGLADAFAVVYNSTGSRLNLDQFGTTGNDGVSSVATLGSLSYFTGFTEGVLAGTGYGGTRDIFVRSYGASLTLNYTRQIQTPAGSEAGGVVADATGIYITGRVEEALPGKWYFGGTDVFVRRLNSGTGFEISTRQFGSSGNEELPGIAIAGTTLYVGGDTDGDLFGSPDGSIDGVVAALPITPFDVNLDVVSFSAPPTAETGEAIGSQMSLTIVNSGTVDAVAPFQIGFTLSPGDFAETTDPLLDNGLVQVNGLAAGNQLVVTIPANVAIPTNANLGGQFLGVIVDIRDEIFETQNGSQTTSNITINPGPVAPGEAIWLDQFGTGELDQVKGVTADATGVYVAGVTAGILPGQSSTSPAGFNDGFVRKYDTDGILLWTRQFGSSDSDVTSDIEVDPATGITYVSGTTIGNDFNNPLTGFQDGFVAKVDATGVIDWVDQFGAPGGNILTNAIAVDVAQNAVYVTGFTNGDFAGQTVQGPLDAFVRKINMTTGVADWTVFIGGTAGEQGHGIAADNNRIYVAGLTGGALPGETNLGNDDAWVVSLTPLGAVEWTRQFGTAQLDAAYGLAFDPATTTIYVVGVTNGELPGQTAMFNADPFVRAYDTAGTELWTLQEGTDGTDQYTDVAVTATDAFIAAELNAQFGKGAVVGASAVRVAQGGSIVWTNTFDANADTDLARAIGTNADGEVYLGIDTDDEFPGQTSAGGFDIVVARLEPGGAVSNNDLTVTDFVAPAAAIVGSDLSSAISFVVRNSGTENVASPFDVGVYVSNDSTITVSDVLLDNGEVTIMAIDAGDSITVLLPDGAAAAAGSPTGNVFIGALVDNGDVITETDETNNFVSSPISLDGDSDGDGVNDSVDLCPGEDASFFDADGDGCIDDVVSGRNIEYWDLSAFPIPFQINENGAAGIGDNSDITAIQNAFAAWDGLPGSLISSTFAGTTTEKDADALDQINLVTFEDPDFVFPAGVIAVGLTTSFTEPTVFNGQLFRPGQILDSDMIFNTSFTYQTPTAGSGKSVQAVATHEVGHLFGISHSAIVTATMFFVLPPAVDATTLELDDTGMAFKAYADVATLATASILEGTVTDSVSGTPVAGAIVYAIAEANGDTVACDYTLPADGSYKFVGLPDGDYTVSIHPLNGSSAIGFIQPQNINSLILATAQTVFVPESWDLNESATDDATAADPITVAANTTATADIVLNIDDVPPVVLDVSPDDFETNIAVDAAVLVQFSESIDDGTIVGNFALIDSSTSQFISGGVTFLNDDSLIVFVPGSPLGYSSIYELTLDTGLSDLFGNGLATPFVSSFRTEAQPDVFLSSLSPNKAIAGATVVISGAGFDDSAFPENNSITFNGVPVTNYLSNTSTELVVEVPAGATSGVVQALVNDELSNTLQFTLLEQSDVPKGYQVGTADLAGALPRSVALTPDGAGAFVATDQGASFVIVDPGDPNFLAHQPIAIADGLNDIDGTSDGKSMFGISRIGQKLVRVRSDFQVAPPTLLNEIPISAEPLGILLAPGGKRAYIPTADREIQVWDTNENSASFELQIGAISVNGANIRGQLAITPAGDRLLALDGAGSLLVIDLAADSIEVAIPIGPNPRDVVVDPLGERAYVTDDTGIATVVSLSLLTNVQNIVAGGTLRGADITPAGGLLFAANRELNLLDIIDLRLESATFREVAATISQPVNPVDVTITSDGLYAISLAEQARSLIVTAIGTGPVIESLSKRAGPVGTTLVIAGGGFADEAVTTVDFNGVSASPDVLVDSTVVVTVPVGATSGAVTVRTVTDPDPAAVSNAVFFEVTDTTQTGGLRISDRVQPPGSPQLAPVVAVSPAGDLTVFGTEDGEIHILDTDPNSLSFNEFIGFSPVFSSPGDKINDMEFTPDGMRLFVMVNNFTIVAVIDMNRGSATFAEGVDAFSVDFSDSRPLMFKVSPDGRRLLVADPVTSKVGIIDVEIGSANLYQILQTLALFGGGSNGVVTEVAYHPAGDYAYLAIQDNTPAELLVLDVNEASPTYFQIVDRLLLPGSSPVEVAVSINFTPDGDRAFVLTFQRDSDNPETITILQLGTTQPESPIVDLIQPAALDLGLADNVVRVSPKADRLVATWGTLSCLLYDISGPLPLPQLGGLGGASHSGSPPGVEFSANGDLVYVASTGVDSVYVLDFNAPSNIAAVSGDNQDGVVNQTLAAPLRVQVSSVVTGVPTPNVPVTFQVTAGGGALDSSADPTTKTVTTEANGMAEVQFTLGSVEGAGAHVVQVSAFGASGSPLSFAANGLTDPSTLPLTIGEIVPNDGSVDVNITTAIQTTFSRAVDPASITTSTYLLRKAGSAVVVPSVVGFADQNRKVSLTPLTPLDPNDNYVIEATTGILDDSGGPLQNPAMSTFATAPPPPLVLNGVDAPSAIENTTVVLSGTGFSSNISENTVLFNGTPAFILEADEDFLDVKVPIGATTGNIVVVVGTQTSNPLPFTVLQSTTSPVDDIQTTIDTGSGTRGIALLPNGSIAYAVSVNANVVIPIDVEGLSTFESISVGDGPFAIDINPSGTRAYVTNLLDNTVSVIDVDATSPTRHTVIDEIIVGSQPIDVLVMPDGDRVIVANFGSDDLSIIDGDELSATFHDVIASPQTGIGTRTIGVLPDGSRVYVGVGDGYLTLGGLDFGVISGTRNGTGTKQIKVVPDGTILIVLTVDGNVDFYDIVPNSPTENAVIAGTRNGTSTKQIQVAPDGATALLIQEEDDIILVISLEALGTVSVLDGVDDANPVFEVVIIDTIMAGEDPQAAVFDPSIPGRVIITNAGDNTVTIFGIEATPDCKVAEIKVLPRTILVDPDISGCFDHGHDDGYGPYHVAVPPQEDPEMVSSLSRYIWAWIELPPECDPHDIDITTVLLNGQIPAMEVFFFPFVDEDGDGIQERRVKFDRVLFEEMMPQGEFVPVEITGLVAGAPFCGETTIRTIRPTITFPVGGEMLLSGTTVTITWDSPQFILPIETVDVLWTPDDGATWLPVALGIPNTGQVDWEVPDEYTTQARVMVTLFTFDCVAIGSGMSPGLFSIDSPLPVALSHFEVSVRDGGGAKLAWKTDYEVGAKGFHLLRATAEEGPYERITTDEIPARGGTSGGTYEFDDTDVRPNQKYYYKLLEVADRGDGQLFGPYEFIVRAQFALGQNYPNPFNPTTTIKFTVAERALVRLVIYDVAGRVVRTLVNEQREANFYETVWDGKDRNGQTVASGVYFYRLQAGTFVETKKMLMLK